MNLRMLLRIMAIKKEKLVGESNNPTTEQCKEEQLQEIDSGNNPLQENEEGR